MGKSLITPSVPFTERRLIKMKMRFNKTEGYTFIVYNENEKVIVDKENNDIQINTLESERLIIELDAPEQVFDLKNWRQKLSLKQWMIVFFVFLISSLYDMLCINIKHLSDFVTPLSETYYLKISDTIERCELTYHKGKFETLSHRYVYPYITTNVGEKLECKFGLNPTYIEASFFGAKLYYFFLIIPIAVVCGIGGGAIWHSNSAIVGCILVFTIIYFVSMNFYLNERKRSLILQLENEL